MVKKVELIDKHEFVKAALNEESEMFVSDVTTLGFIGLNAKMHASKIPLLSLFQ